MIWRRHLSVAQYNDHIVKQSSRRIDFLIENKIVARFTFKVIRTPVSVLNMPVL